ncbi:hypothetical protein HG536_0E05160 [Torulaspora globosa]|uniref:TOG domain-containing protein n=1 Tax=Torulaspora globosa TaxID=48254 RepID=A0A7G3ZJB9_9SACH|nr:uncharacterized protein HG536_0E05160 [Torulaspora globosa]QLL33605.1 hypothetical protein HG536_0E05160 [Torulaspora globosa]
MSVGIDQEDEDFTKLSLDERLAHKLWKARLHAYQELLATFQGSQRDRNSIVYWSDPEQFARYVTDSNVAAQEQAVLALEALLRGGGLPAQNVDLSQVISLWVSALVEKALTSSRAATRTKALDCILLLCAYDESITRSVRAVLPFFQNKLPKLVAASVNCVAELVKSYQFINTEVNVLLADILEPLVKLAGHADRNVRGQTMSLVVEIYNATGRSKVLLQEMLLDRLKPIQQNDLQKLFDKASNEPAENQPRLSFRWQEAQRVDKDGDTLMDMKPVSPQEMESNGLSRVKNIGEKIEIDPFDLLPEQTILDKLPVDFHEKINSTKWKDRVESLQEFWNPTVSSVKKLKSRGQDYTEILNILGHIVQKDANVQAVTIAAQCIKTICEKLRTPGFTKHYASLVFVPLLERTKEKKPSAIDSIRQTLKVICHFYNPLNPTGHNEDMLQEILEFMKHKTPQVRMEATNLFTFVINEINDGEVRVLKKYLEDEIIPTVLKIVNDTQPTIRNSGFECFATLIRLLGKRELSIPLETLDGLKRKKIQEFLNGLPAVTERKENVLTNETSRPSSSPHLSTIPTKRGPSSPLQKVAKASSPSAARSRVLLTSRSLATSQQAISPGPPSAVTKEVERSRREKQEWIRERHQLINQINNLTGFQTELSNENDSLREQLKMAQTSLHEKNLQIRSKELQLSKLQDRVAQLEAELKQQQQHPQGRISSSDASAVSTNLGVRSLSSSSFDPKTTKSKHCRTPSESSDDLPRRVDSLQLNNEMLNEESWKRAAEVTSQLKARIERMRAKSKGVNSNV